MSPAYVQPYRQFDAGVSYRAFDNVALFAEGMNIADEVNRRVGRYNNRTLLYGETAPRAPNPETSAEPFPDG